MTDMLSNPNRGPEEPGRGPGPSAPSPHGIPLPVDNGPVRERAVVEVRKAMRALDKAQGAMRAFEQEDRPLFQRWYHATFAAELARIRELEEEAVRLRGRVEEVRELMAACRLDAHAAWLLAQEMREHPERFVPRGGTPDGRRDPYGSAADLFGWTASGGGGGPAGEGAEDPDDEDDGDGAEASLLSDGEIQELFVRFLERTTNLDPFAMDESTRGRLLARFRLEVLGIRPEAPEDGTPAEEREAASPEDLKRLYRLLVRRLHPDFNPAPAERLRDAWNRVQAAYREGDVRELELIAALCDVDGTGVADVSSVSRLLSIRDECRERTGVLLGELAEAREDPAWGFSRTAKPARALVLSIREELTLSAAQASIAVAALERRLRRYARVPGLRRGGEDREQLRLPFAADPPPAAAP